MGAVYEVNNADVICGNMHTANATVYVINKVLIPMHDPSLAGARRVPRPQGCFTRTARA